MKPHPLNPLPYETQGRGSKIVAIRSDNPSRSKIADPKFNRPIRLGFSLGDNHQIKTIPVGNCELSPHSQMWATWTNSPFVILSRQGQFEMKTHPLNPLPYETQGRGSKIAAIRFNNLSRSKIADQKFNLPVGFFLRQKDKEAITKSKPFP